MSGGLYPLQFIEGINEDEEATDNRFLEFREYGAAIPYTPSLRYNLARIEIYGSSGEKTKPHKTFLLTDHNGAPSKTVVADGRLVVTTEVSEQWLRVELNQPIVVFERRKYWLTFPEHPLTFSIGYAKEGNELTVAANPNGTWLTSDRKWRLMLRFFGRALPVQ